MPSAELATTTGSLAGLSAEETARAMVANPRWADRLGWGGNVEAIGVLLGGTGLGAGDADLAQLVAAWQVGRGLVSDGIVGPKTWSVLKLALAPPTSLTGVLPPGLPAVPDGFDEVIATFGDPRPLIARNGKLSKENEAAWQRQTLARGTLPFSIPLDPRKPRAGSKTTFYAHRKLVGAFEAVFQEIVRLGLRDQVRSWGGIYNFRPIRGASSRLSLHCFGAAIDLNSETNGLGTPGDMHGGVVEIFEHFGFFWGGNFRGRSDPMHFQYATGY
jgi:hypothetical protein